MFDSKYFTERLVQDAKEKGTGSTDQTTVEIALLDGSHYKVAAICEALPGCVVVEVHPDGVREDRKAIPGHKLDRVAISYDSIVTVRLTLTPPSHGIGFRP